MMTISTAPSDTPATRSLSELAALVNDVASRPGDWIARARLSVGERWYERLESSDTHEVWAISWLPGQATGFHDHGGSAGAFTVAFGTLQEHRSDASPLTVGPGHIRAFGPHDVHDVRNASTAPAISIRAYSPPLSLMNRFELADAELIPTGTVFEGGEDAASAPESLVPHRKSINEVMAAARARLRRLSPRQAHEAIGAGAVLVDIRPAAQREAEGAIPGALLVERNVLEWRFDPASDARLPAAVGCDLPVVVVCSEGYTSSLAAVSLQDLGLLHATDIIGGLHAWRAAGLPTLSLEQDAPR